MIIPDLSGGNAADYRIGLDVMSYYGAGSDDGAFADGDAGHNGGVHADKGATFDADFSDDLFSFIKMPGQVVSDHDAHCCDGYVVFDGDEFGAAVINKDHVADLDFSADVHAFEAMEKGAESFPGHEPGRELDAVAPEAGEFRDGHSLGVVDDLFHGWLGGGFMVGG